MVVPKSLYFYSVTQISDNVAHHTGRAGSSVAFIGIDMHSESVSRVNSYDNVTENEASAIGFSLNGNDLLVYEIILFSILGSHMNVSYSDDNAVLKLYFTFRTYDLTAAAAFKVTAFTDGSLYADASGIAC